MPDREGKVLESAIPSVLITKDGGYCTLKWGDDPEIEDDLKGLIAHKLAMGKLAGLVVEGTVPIGNMTSTARLKLIFRAAYCGLPVVRVARGSHEGFAAPHPAIIAGSNLTATKARFLLMACLLKFWQPADAKLEREATTRAIEAYRRVFDSH